MYVLQFNLHMYLHYVDSLILGLLVVGETFKTGLCVFGNVSKKFS
jgi:hypothetical protein